jgi:hypothetical protein
MAKWKFKKQYEDAIVSLPFLGLEITKENLKDEHVEIISKKFPKFMHNFEFGGDAPKEEVVEEAEVPVKKKRKSRKVEE